LDLVSPRAREIRAPNVTVHSAVRAYTDEWFGLFADSDVLVVPSFAEPFGLVYIEAMAAGLPVVMGDTLAARDIVGASEAGRVVTAGDTEELVAVLQQFVRDPELVERMGHSARLRATACFDAAANMRALADLAVEAAR